MVMMRTLAALLGCLALAAAQGIPGHPGGTVSFRTQQLFDSDFEHKTQASTGQTTGIWLVKFCSQRNEACQRMQSGWDDLADAWNRENEEQIQFAEVQTDWNPKLTKRFHVKYLGEPTVILFRNQRMYYFPSQLYQQDMAAGVKAFLSGGSWESAHSTPVPKESHSMGEVVDYLRNHLGIFGFLLVILSVAGMFFTFAHTVYKAKKEPEYSPVELRESLHRFAKSQ